jgi:hypothetical protein
MYTVGSLPAAGTNGAIIIVTDATPNATICFDDGANWIDINTGTTVV